MLTSSSTFEEISAFAEAGIRSELDSFVLPVRTIDVMENNGVKAEEIDKIVGRIDSRKSKSDDGMLTADASERVARLAHIISLAQKVFGSDQKAFFWLRAPNGQLSGNTPINYIRRETGARFVEDILIRIDHGIAA